MTPSFTADWPEQKRLEMAAAVFALYRRGVSVPPPDELLAWWEAKEAEVERAKEVANGNR